MRTEITELLNASNKYTHVRRITESWGLYELNGARIISVAAPEGISWTI